MNKTVEDKSFCFAIKLVELYKGITNTEKEFIMSKQLLRSGTSIGANIAEAQQAQSRADFISKLSIALKESCETDYWLRLLHATGYINDASFSLYISDCREIEKMLTAIIKSAKPQAFP
ncbi:MAG: four helix bundle protein [Ruminococcaceae bacterium]|nr:four helix bundle protein [Oscillospiraceae bacterium]